MATRNSKASQKQSLNELFEEMKHDFYALEDIAKNYHRCPFTDFTMQDVIEHFSGRLEKGLDKAARLFSETPPPEYRESIEQAKLYLARLCEFADDMGVRAVEMNKLPARAKRSSLLWFVSEVGGWISEAARLAGLDGADFDTERKIAVQRASRVVEVAHA